MTTPSVSSAHHFLTFLDEQHRNHPNASLIFAKITLTYHLLIEGSWKEREYLIYRPFVPDQALPQTSQELYDRVRRNELVMLPGNDPSGKERMDQIRAICADPFETPGVEGLLDTALRIFHMQASSHAREFLAEDFRFMKVALKKLKEPLRKTSLTASLTYEDKSQRFDVPYKRDLRDRAVYISSSSITRFLDFIDDLKESRPNADIESIEFTLNFSENVKGEWVERVYRCCRPIFLPEHLPKTTQELYDRIKSGDFAILKNIDSLPLEQQDRIKKVAEICQQPFESPLVQGMLKIALSIFTAEIGKDPLLMIEEELRKMHRHAVDRPNEVQKTYFTSNLTYSTRENRREKCVVTYDDDLKLRCNYCSAWRTTAHKLKICGRCRNAFWCGPECAWADWKEHKITCSRSFADRSSK